ncbi:MAG: hypothetical protein QM677_08915 [Microbacterium sp.]
MPRRLAQLLIGLVLYGVGLAFMVRAGIGLDPWTVLAQGIERQTGIGIGWVTNALGLSVLLLWIPLRQRPGIGTVANVLLVGTAMQASLLVVPVVSGFGWQLVTFAIGMGTVALASGLYLGSDLGPGPRDGLMTGLNSRLGWPIWVSRSIVEASVLVTGWALGGTVGIGTLAFALCIGPLVQIALPPFDLRRVSARRGSKRSHSTLS